MLNNKILCFIICLTVFISLLFNTTCDDGYTCCTMICDECCPDSGGWDDHIFNNDNKFTKIIISKHYSRSISFYANYDFSVSTTFHDNQYTLLNIYK